MAITPIEPGHPGIHFDESPTAIDSTTLAVHLACTQAGLLAMTPRQRDVFRQLCCLQMGDAGPHSLLPHVVAAFRELAACAWWDAAMAGLPREPGLRE